MGGSRAPAGERIALLGCLLVSGCYLGSARNATPADLANDRANNDRWERVTGVPEIRQVAREDCGAAALAMVLDYWGLPTARDQIAAAYQETPARGIRAQDLRAFARERGLEAFLVRGQLADLDRELARRRPVLVGVMKRYGRRAYPHYEVVVGIDRRTQRILTLDPAYGPRVNSRDGFVAEWAAAQWVTLIVFPRTNSKEPQ